MNSVEQNNFSTLVNTNSGKRHSTNDVNSSDMRHCDLFFTRDSNLLGELWPAAVAVYPDLEQLHDHLASLSSTLSDQYISYLLSSKQFNERFSLAESMEKEFLNCLWGENTELKNYFKFLQDHQLTDVISVFVKYVEAVGSNVELSTIKSLIDQEFTNLFIYSNKKNPAEQQANQAQRKLKSLSEAAPAVDGVNQLKSSLIGRFYINHIKTIPIARSMVIWLWRNCYPKYVNFKLFVFYKTAHKARPLIALQDYVKTNKSSVFKVLVPEIVETPAPQVFPIQNQDLLIAPHQRYQFPEIFIATIKNAKISGGTNLTLVDSETIYHDLYDFKCDYTSEELHHRTLINPKQNSIRWLSQDASPKRIPVAASFIDACAPNYAHWLTEVLPRIAVFCSIEELSAVPIIVNEGLHKNIMESLFLIVKDREIITLPVGSSLIVETLYCTSVTGYVPFDRRSNKVTSGSHGLFSAQSFQMLNLKMESLTQRVEEDLWPEKIYIRRNSGIRKVTNSVQVERLLHSRGYVVVEPEKLNFSQQVQLFSHAKSIIGSSGAALANLVFCPKNATIIILIGKFPNTSYWYWQNMACASGKIVNYVFGQIANTHAGIHADFEINLEDLAAALDNTDKLNI